MTFTLTEEQQACVDAAVATNDNLLIEALAGAAKTTTLVEIAKAVRVSTLCIAFNKKIAMELQDRMPSTCECKTLHALGYKALYRFFGNKKLTLRDSKNFDLLSAEIDNSANPESLRENMSDLLWAINVAQNEGWIPEGHHTQFRPLVTDEDFFGKIENDPERGWAVSPTESRVIRAVVSKGIHMALNDKVINFNDMVYLPAIMPVQFSQYALTMVDESQDLSILNHKLIRKITGPKGRLIAVGDPCQAIYGFRGAHGSSMELLQQTFNMRQLTLSTSFRCSRLVAEHVRWRAPHIRSPEWAIDGSVRRLELWGADTLPAEAAIICRNNAPIFRAALRLIRVGRRPQIIGNDILKGLVKDLKKLGKVQQAVEEVMPNLDLLEKKLKAKYKGAAHIDDKIEAMRHFLEVSDTLGAAIAEAERLMNSTGPLHLMTGHKSKGLEFSDVFILDEFLLRPEGQDLNLRYVMATRAKNNLTYVLTEGWQG